MNKKKIFGTINDFIYSYYYFSDTYIFNTYI